MGRNKYQLMKESLTVFDSNGNAYPDLATFPLESLIINTKPLEYKLNENDTLRFFDLIYQFYDSFDFYDDIILWLNDIDYIFDTEKYFESKIKFFSKKDLDAWYLNSLIGETIIKDNKTEEK